MSDRLYLEHLVEPKLAQALSWVPKERGRPTLGQALHAFFAHRNLEAADKVAIFGRVDLDAALDQIKRDHQCVCDTARQDTYNTMLYQLFIDQYKSEVPFHSNT